MVLNYHSVVSKYLFYSKNHVVVMVIWGTAETLLAIKITVLFIGRPSSFPM
jgi:hypothetical protein